MARRLSPRSFKHKITLQNPPSRVADDQGGNSNQTPTTFLSVWARVQPLSGRENYAAMQLQGTITHKVVMRYVAGVNQRMTIDHSGRSFKILSVRDVMEDERMLELLCEEERV